MTTDQAGAGAQIFPCLLRDLVIDRSFLYLMAVIDWASRAVLAWQLSNTMDVAFCIDALDEALARFGRPGIFNADQDSQFTNAALTGRLASTAGCVIGGNDLLIAAHAVALGCTIVTDNVREVSRIQGLAIESWLR